MNQLDYFKKHPAGADNVRPEMAWRYGYLVGIVKGVMVARNHQQMKDALGDALEYLGEMD